MGFLASITVQAGKQVINRKQPFLTPQSTPAAYSNKQMAPSS